MLNKLADNNVVNILPQQGAKTAEAADLGNIVSWGINVIIIVAGIIFFFMLLIGGIQWLTSGGDKGGTEAARGRITAALIGLIIVFAAWAIVKLLESVFGLNIITFTIPTVT